MNKRILIVEDDLSLGFLLMEFLETEGFDVKLCRDGDSGLSSFQNGRFDLCLIDVMLPKMDGFCLAKKIRMNCLNTPFIFLTARSMKRDKLEGYSLGAEDYVTKPFDEDELLCKIQVVMRRNASVEQKTSQPTEFQIGDFFYNSNLQELTYNGVKKRLTEKENEVLHLLCLNQNQILRRQDAVEKIYGKYDYFLGRSFDVFISRLRKILSQDKNICIENVFKVGFILKVNTVEATV
jgi:DNA-binding response OmpR family regulator